MSDSLRDAVSAAFEQAESSATPASEPAETTAAPPAASEPVATEAKAEASEVAPSAGAKRDEKGRFAPAAAKASTTQPATATEQPAAPTARKDAAEGGPPPVATQPTRPPSSWKPQYRERWEALPPDIQQEVLRVDKEIVSTMAQAAAARRFQEQFQQTIAPFESHIRAEGSDPIRMVGNLLQTAVALRTAPPAHRAQLVAQIVKSYGVPIDALDAALVGEQPAGGQSPNIDPRSIAEQVRREVLSGLTQRAQQANAARAQQEAAAFEQDPANEFLEDVRQDMADLLEVAGRQGRALSLKDAYDRACRLNDNVRAVLEQRAAAKTAANAQASTQRAKAAGSSVKSQPAGMAAPKELNSIRDYVEAAWDAGSQR